MPAPVIAAIIGAGAAVGGAELQRRSANKATQAQVDAANKSAELQKQSNDEALHFQEQEAQRQREIDEVNRRANYDQWAAQQRRFSDIGVKLGLAPREIPAYVPMQPGQPTTGTQPGTPSGNVPTLGDTFDPQAAAAAFAQAYPGKSFDANYWAQKWPELVARGKQLNDPTYAAKRLMGWQAGGADAPTSGPYAGQPASAPRVPTAATFLTSPTRPMTPIAPGLTMPDPYRVGAAGSYF